MGKDRYCKVMGVLFMKGRERMWKNECVSIDLFIHVNFVNIKLKTIYCLCFVFRATHMDEMCNFFIHLYHVSRIPGHNIISNYIVSIFPATRMNRNSSLSQSTNLLILIQPLLFIRLRCWSSTKRIS
jgi:hypothetical protein